MDNSTDEKGFRIERGTVSSGGFTAIDSVDASQTTYTDTNLTANEMYFYRVKAYNDKGLSDYSNVANASTGGASNVLLMKDTIVKTCNTVLLDPGAIGDYPNDKNIITTFIPSVSGNKVAITFSEFNLEQYNDYLYINDGADINAPLIGAYTGNEIPPRVVATNAEGKLTVQFISSRDNPYPGFKANISCLNPNSPPDVPSNLTASVFTTKVSLNWTDNSYNENGFIVERSTKATTSFSKIGETGINATSYTDLKGNANTLYYYRVKSSNNQYSSSYSNVASAKTGDKPIIMKNAKIKTCNAVFLDPGGFENVQDNLKGITTTIEPGTSGKRIQIAFSEFNLNFGSDVLMVYDGPNVNSPVLFDGTLNWTADTLTANNSMGALTFKLSTGTYNYSGWVGTIRCINFPPKAPTDLKVSLNASNYVALNWKDNSDNEEGFIILKSFYTNQSYSELARVPANTTEYIDTYGYSQGVKLFYKVISANKDGGKSIPSNEAAFMAPLIMSNTWFYSCDYTLVDAGASDNYSDNSLIQMTVYPDRYRTKIALSFTSFDTEKDHDFLTIYDGENTSAPILGKFSGNALPPKIKSTNSYGALTLVFSSDGAINKSGWDAFVSCAASAEKPSPETASLRSIEENESELTNQITVFPNPASSSFKIQLPAQGKWESIDAVDLTGVKKTLLRGDLKGQLEIDATQMKRGLNMLVIRSKTAVVTKRILIE